MHCIARKILHIAIAASSQSCDFFTTYNASLTYKLIANPYWLLSFLTFSAFGKHTQRRVNQICEDLIRNVTNCDLDYKMHQTPFSLFFSIRKKLTKNSNYGASFQNPVPSGFKEELLYVRQEYRNLFNFYQAEIEAKKQI